MERTDPAREDIARLESAAAGALAKGRFERALHAYEALIEREPKTPRHRLRAADCLARLQRTADAVRRYCQAARMYHASGREPQALAVWRIAHSLDATNHDAAVGLLEAEAALATTRFISTTLVRPAVEVEVVEEEITPIGLPVERLSLQSSRDAIGEELAKKQRLSAPESEPEIVQQPERLRIVGAQEDPGVRAELDRALAADVARARRFGLELAVLVLDGARREEVEPLLRISDSASTIPGGRLVIAALGASVSGARRIAEKIRHALGADVRAGIARLPDRRQAPRPPSPRELIAMADAALERAIEDGHHAAVARAGLDVDEALDARA